MKRFLYILLLLFINSIEAQFDPNDCIRAITVCGNGVFQSDASGIGTTQEVSGCSGFEHNSIWLKINIIQGGTLGFDLIPNNTNISVDYDFWVYGPNKNCGSGATGLGTPIRCCTTNPALAGLSNNHTGMNLSTLSVTSGPGANGIGYVRSLTVSPGQFYYICIDRPVGDGGFSLQWTGTANLGAGAFPVPPPANAIPDYKTCSNTPNVGIFDLGSRNTLINSNLILNTIKYYRSLSDAIAQINPIPYIMGNSTNPQLVFARVTDNITKCYSLTSFNLVVYPVPNVAMSTSSSSICSGDNVTVTFSGTPNTSFQYTVNGGPTQSAILNATTGLFTITESLTSDKTYELVSAEILDALGNAVCTQNFTNSLTVTVNPLPTVGVNSSTVCQGDTATVLATPTSVGTFTYLWTLPTGVANPGNVPSFITTAAGIYDVVITDSNTGCSSASTSGTVIANSNPSVIVNSTSVCQGNPANVIANPTSPGTYSYSWTVPTGVSNPGDTASFNTITVGLYNVIITDTVTGCTSISASSTVSINTSPTVTLNSPTICQGSQATLTAIPSSIGTYSYLWTVPTSLTNPGNVSSLVTSTAGTYSVIITDMFTGCSSTSASGIVNINSNPSVSVNNLFICQGTTATIIANPSDSETYSYAWTVPSGVTNPGDVVSFSTTSAGVYSVVINDVVTGCSSTSSSGTVTINLTPLAPTVAPVSYCQNANASTLSAAGSNLLWYTVANGGVGS
ncbi:MAG: hypothetical protein ACOYK3_12000, partial [Flavobacterium sp.]